MTPQEGRSALQTPVFVHQLTTSEATPTRNCNESNRQLRRKLPMTCGKQPCLPHKVTSDTVETPLRRVRENDFARGDDGCFQQAKPDFQRLCGAAHLTPKLPPKTTTTSKAEKCQVREQWSRLWKQVQRVSTDSPLSPTLSGVVSRKFQASVWSQHREKHGCHNVQNSDSTCAFMWPSLRMCFCK